ncbi:MAG TPA: discoidin domain-containing protein [Blastocatellia bacterium]|nr:discoidin domain-containing protein [Blastocatellia bacterium]
MRSKKGLSTIMAAPTLAALLLITASAAAAQLTYQAKAVRPVAVAGDLADIANANDGQLNTRAVSTRNNYAGQSLTLDIGGMQNVVGVVQDHGRWPAHYSGAYQVEVAASENGPWMKTFEGAGSRGESKAVFDAVRARFIRITATRGGGGGPDWAVAEVKAGIDPGATNVRTIPATAEPPRENPRDPRPGQLPDLTNARIGGTLKDIQLAVDGKQDTRAVSGTPDYAGMYFVFDLGGEYELSRVVQVHNPWPEDYPGEYKIEVSRRRDENAFREVWRGAGERGRSGASFDPVTTRYVRVTALRNKNRTNWWSVTELRTNRDEEVVEDNRQLERPIRRATAQGFANIERAIDDDTNTYATTQSPEYNGSFILLDLGGSYTISRVVQVHTPYDQDFPRRYRVEVSEDGSRWRTVWEGEGGANGRSVATFDSTRARHVRITATQERRQGRGWWTISSLRVSG